MSERGPTTIQSITNDKKIAQLQKQRLKKKGRKKRKQEKRKTTTLLPTTSTTTTTTNPSSSLSPHSPLFPSKGDPQQATPDPPAADDAGLEIEYIAANPLETIEPEEEENYDSLRDVLEHFTLKSTLKSQDDGKNDSQNKTEEKPVQEKLSKKKRKLQRRLPIAVLKQLVSRPDLVEIHDTCAADPFLLLQLKSYQNTVPVPRHWSQKRKYLQGKRGIEKLPFDLPVFIKNTGIMEVRSAGLEKDAEKTLKQDQREKLNPSMGKMDIDYQVLHDAFFKYQTKPKMTGYGDLYYEGKEYEVEMKEKRPGILSKELKESLGMPDGAPPPWLINMQRVGPPPSYPHLKIPGLNAPIPPEAEYGYHPGGWGRPPVDEQNRPLYGNAFGEEEIQKTAQYVEISHWGRLPSEEEESSSEAEEPEGEAKEEGEGEPDEGPGDEDIGGMETPLSGLETPQNVEGTLRKPRKDEERELYEVLEERETSVGGAVFGSNRQYVIEKAKKPKGADRVELMKSQKTEAIDIALDPSELATLTEEGLKKRYDKFMQEKKDREGRVYEETSRKRKRTHPDAKEKKSKKYKDFKF